MANVTVFVLLPVYNRKAVTLSFISYLKKQSYEQWKLILIDDGSEDFTARAVQEMVPDAIVLHGNGNWWWAGCLQRGFQWLQKNTQDYQSIVLIVNDDTRIEPDFMAEGVAFLEQHPRTLALANAFNVNTGQLEDCGVRYDFQHNVIYPLPKESEINCLSTRGLFLRLQDFIEIGGFRPRLLPHYTSDYEFTIRAGRKGFKLRSPLQLKLWYNSESTGIRDELAVERWNGFVKKYFSTRNSENPIYLIIYYLLAFPAPYNLKHALKALKRARRKLGKVARYSFKEWLRAILGRS